MAPGSPVTPDPIQEIVESFPGERLVVMGAAICLLVIAITLAVCMCSPKCYLYKKCSRRKQDEEECLTPSSQDSYAGTFRSLFEGSPVAGQWKTLRGFPFKQMDKSRSQSTQSLASTDRLSEPKVAVELAVRWDDQAKTCSMELVKMVQLDLPRKYRDTMMTLTTTIQTKDSFRSTYTKLQQANTGYIARLNVPTHLEEKVITHLTASVSKALLTFDVCQTSALIAPFPLWKTSLPLMPLLAGEASVSIPLKTPAEAKRGEVVVSVFYMPVAEKLSVSLMECQGLDKAIREDLDKTPEFYTKIALSRHGQTLIRKKTKTLDIKPIVMMSEAFTFDVPRAHADEIKLLVTVLFLGDINGHLVEERLGRATFSADMHPTWDMVLKQTRKPQLMRQNIV